MKELLKSGLFEITVLTRESSSHDFPSGVKVAKVDYRNVESLTAALKGQDALVSAVASVAASGQRVLIDAAVEAGVKRIIPSEYATRPSSSYFYPGRKRNSGAQPDLRIDSAAISTTQRRGNCPCMPAKRRSKTS